MGKMAQAIWVGLKETGLCVSQEIAYYDISTQQCDFVEKTHQLQYLSISELVPFADVIIFCVKPQNIGQLLLDFPRNHLEKKMLVSILAGITIEKYEQYLGKNIQMVRVMPNTPALIHAGMTALAFNANVTEKNKLFASDIFQSLGEIQMVDEHHMDAVTGISGSGPAFIYRLAHDIALTGELEGLDYQVALKLIAQTFVGAGAMLQDSGKLPDELIKDVSSPNGTTVAGLTMFDNTNIDSDIKKVITAAIVRSKELGK